jgi:hypothetical protein
MTTAHSLDTEHSDLWQDETGRDEACIDLLDSATLLKWSYRLVVTPFELKQAIAIVGSSAAKICAYLGLSDFAVWPTSIQVKGTQCCG